VIEPRVGTSRFIALACVVGAMSLACEGPQSEPAPVAAIIVPSTASARTVPGGAVSFEAACTSVKLPATHAWEFPGGDPESSTSIAGVVRFPAAGTFRISYRCTGADGKSSAPATQTILVAAPGPSALHIVPQYLSTTAEATLAPAIDAAVAVLSSLVVGPVPGVETTEAPWADCGNVSIVAHAGELKVLVDLVPLDGAQGLVALSSPCYVRAHDNLPFVGFMKFDAADVPNLPASKLDHVVLHELLHVLGFGTLWDQPGLPLLIGGRGTSDPFLAGANGRAAFRDFDGGAGYAGSPVPLDGAGPIGSRERHWRASIFGTELMTPTVGPASPVSRTTLGALADLGWWVNAEAADPFLIVTTSFAALRLSPEEGLDVGDDALPIVPRLR
jgi:hypothetical protein